MGKAQATSSEGLPRCSQCMLALEFSRRAAEPFAKAESSHT